ncbi:hypothetical protein [Pseudomonas cannabina]|uniref:Type III effector protein AvrPto1 n=2 Tax=Pseudomonas cannabina TaxID=86840 RepID=A0A0P9LB59_PSECA|nr:hypothetical protein [Pseudomonas cannabina]KAA8694916.1 hypothetical protein F4W70_29165 [Pseudomonas cannabina]KPW71493.1 hypothetical protein ALO81_200327 [Pseudomonas cannabina]RMN27863.1 hypothetical protein ALQ64_03370 [Pseudomonas cannabina]SDR56093.1 hypothetical protein SAMN05216597_5962 [Pseudomonas cannabina]
MFEILKMRIFVAKVQAELMAQHRDQDFVNTICQLPKNLNDLNFLRKNSYYKKEKIAPFIAACHVLCESLESKELNSQYKIICASLLAKRIQKSEGNQHFYLRHIQLFQI